MYKLAENTDLIHRAHRVCSADAKRMEHILKRDYGISAQAILVGSAKRKLITQNGNNRSFDFDYNLTVADGFEYDPAYLKNCVRSAFNDAIRESPDRTHLFGHPRTIMCYSSDVRDSTSSLTTKPMHFLGDYTGTVFHMDVAVITQIAGYWNRLISFPSFKCYIEAVNEIYSQYH